jgi:hypothetical protein
MDVQVFITALLGLMTLLMVVLPIGMGLFYLFDSDGAWRYAERRLRRIGIIAYRTPAWERQRVLSGIFALTVGIIFAHVLVVNFAPLLLEPAAAATLPTDGVFVTPTPLGR